MAHPETRFEAKETVSTPERVWFEHSLIRHEVGDMHPCVAPRRMQNLEGKWVDQGKSLYENQCAIRMSDALRRAGIRIPKHILQGVVTCGAHAPEEMHVLRARELAQALATMSNTQNLPGFKRVKKLSGDEIKRFFAKIPQKPGIVYISGYWRKPGDSALRGDHIDMFNGYRTTAKPYSQTFNVVGGLPNYQHAQEVWYFEVEDEVLRQFQQRKASVRDDVPVHRHASLASTVSALSLSLRVHLGRTIGGTFDDAEGADNRELIMSRRTALGVGAFVAAAVPFLSTPAQAQQRQRDRKAQGTEQIRESVYATRIRAFERRLQDEQSVLKNGSVQDVQRLLFARTEVPAFEMLPEAERRALHTKVHTGYLTPEQERETGRMSFPIVPSKITPPAIFDAKRGFPDYAEMRRNPLIPLYDGSTWYSNGVRVGEEVRLLEGMYAFSVSGRREDLMGAMKTGQQSFAINRKLSGPFSKAGVLSFDEQVSRAAHGSWVDALWLKNPDVTENNGGVESRSLEWDAQIAGGFLLDIKENPALMRFVEHAVRQYSTRGESSTHQLQQELVLGALPHSRLLLLSNSDVHYYEHTMQHVSGGAIVKADGTGKPVLVGQALWRIHLPKADGAHQVALIVTDTDQTKHAFGRSI